MISLTRRGAISTLSVEVERELTEEDIVQLQNLPDNSPPPVQAISARHRRTALMVAEGKGNHTIADALGYTPARIYQLKQDPSFKELVRYYSDQIHEESLADEKRFQEKLRIMGEQAMNLINDRLDDPDRSDRISTSELRQIATAAADRTVAPPKAMISAPTSPTEITLNFGTTLKPREKVVEETPSQALPPALPPTRTITPTGEDADDDREWGDRE
jgi:hypothetical protein